MLSFGQECSTPLTYYFTIFHAISLFQSNKYMTSKILSLQTIRRLQ